MKKIISLIFVAVLCLSLFACSKGSSDINSAAEYLTNLYKDKATVTPSDFEVVGSMIINKVNYTVSWSVDVTSVTVKTEGDKIIIDVDEKSEQDVPYVLTATIKDPKGKSTTVKFNYTVPKFKELTWNEFTDAEDGSAVVILGVLTGIVETSKENDLYLEDKDGGYFVYSLEKKPSELGLKAGMTVRVSGVRDTYYGVNQIKNATVEIVDSTIKAVEPTDITEIFKNADDLKSDDLTSKQSMLVTIKGATILGQDAGNNTYYNFSLGDKKTYVRISSSTSMLDSNAESTFVNNVKKYYGYSSDVTGLISIYNNNIYLVPVNENAFSNFAVANRTPAEQVEFEKALISIATKITQSGSLDLPTEGSLYKDVKITWSVKENTFASIDGSKLTVTLPETATDIVLTATLTSGDISGTTEFTVSVSAAPKFIPEVVDTPEVGKGYKLFLTQLTRGETLYFAGAMNGYYIDTVTDPDKSPDVFIELVEGKTDEYYLYFMDGEIKTYITVKEAENTKTGKMVANLYLEIRTANTYKYNKDLKTLVTTVKIDGVDKTYYIGTYNNYNTFSLSETSYVTGENASKFDKTNFVGHFATLINIDSVSDDDKIAAEKELLTFTDAIKANTEIELPSFGSKYSNVSIAWTVDGDAVIESNVLKVTLKEEASTIKLTATIKSGDKTATKEFTVAVSAIPKLAPVVADTPVVGTAYKFGLCHGNYDNAIFYITGQMDGYYYATTEVYDDAVDVYIENASDGKYYIYCMLNGKKTYLNIVKSGTYTNVVFGETAITEYSYDADLKTFVTIFENNKHVFGTRTDKNYKTFSACNIEKYDYPFAAQFYTLG